MTGKLKPCPFCGGEAKIGSRGVYYSGEKPSWSYQVYCPPSNNCSVRPNNNKEYMTKEQAIEAWNKRVRDAE